MKQAFAILLVALMANVAGAQTLVSGATVCESKEAILAAQSALDVHDTKKHEELITLGRCHIVNGDRNVAVTNACKGEVRKIIMDGTPLWCLTRSLR